MDIIRVDDRLIHGQVSVGWGSYINPRHMIIANDEIASDSSESELYLLGVPDGIKGAVVPVSGVKFYLDSIGKGPYILVVRSLKDALRLLDSGFVYDKLNVGGIHLIEGKREVIHYIFMDCGDVECLEELIARGIDVSIQDLPSNKKFTAEYIINKWKHDER